MKTKFYTFLFFVVTFAKISSAQQRTLVRDGDFISFSPCFDSNSSGTYIDLEVPQLSPPANPKDIFEAVGLRIFTNLETSGVYITAMYADVPVNILITDIADETICRRRLQPREYREVIDMSNYARGIYHIEISIGNAKQVWKLILK